MASSPPFELEDQTDEDFFDKLVDDDDVDVGVIGGGGLKSIGLLPDVDEILDGGEFDEGKTFAKLSLSDSFEAKAVDECDGNVRGQQIVEPKDQGVLEGKALLDFSSSDYGNVSEPDLSFRGENVGSVSGDASFKEQRVEATELPVVYGRNVIQSSMSPGSFSSENGHVSNDMVVISEAKSSLKRESSGSLGSSVKEVQWGNFNESSEHGKDGFGSYSDFFANLGEGAVENTQGDIKSGNEASKTAIATENLFSYTEYQGESGTVSDQSAIVEDVNNAQDWDNLYPGWKYDPNTGQWYQYEQENFNVPSGNVLYGDNSYQTTSDVQSSVVSYAHQTAQSPVETVSQLSASETVSGWNHISQENGEHQYPAHMLFDPQYPGWYYDTIAQEWRSLNDYHSSTQLTDHSHNQEFQNGSLSTNYYHHGDSQGNISAYQLSAQSTAQAHNQPFQNGSLSTPDYYHGNSGKDNNNALQSHSSDGINQTSVTPLDNYGHHGTNFHHSDVTLENRSWENSYDPNLYSNNHANQPNTFDSWDDRTSNEKPAQSDNNTNWANRSQSFIPSGGAFQQLNPNLQGQQDGTRQYLTGYYGGQNGPSNPQPFFANAQHVSSGQTQGRSSAGRPPHALVTFGFGGKLVIMKDSTGGFSSFGSKDPNAHSISVCNLVEAVCVNNGTLGTGTGAGTCSYFNSLCHQSFPGPLVGGNAGNKELNRWIDERITNSELMDMDYYKTTTLKLLLSLLKVACQHYGKLRSYGTDTGLTESDLPESAVANLFASAKSQFNEYGTTAKCFTSLPSEAQIQTTATEVQHLLISGRKKEALERAQGGQLWDFALILAGQLGEQFYADTVKQMAISQLAIGSPLRTLCLLIAKKPEEVFSNNIVGVDNMPQIAQNVGYSMLDNWEENLAVITANRTENDQLVIIHLGDSLWKEKNDVTAAHICYLVAEADLESYSDSARLCLIGANHLSFPRTYASPEAIQRTEFFEYTKALGNSQFVLLSLQPYKLIYAHMLAEVGRVSESLKYCQAISKSLKTGRSQEAGTLKQFLTSLEDRIKTYQQSGYAANLAPGKIVGKFLNFIDSTAHRVVGGLPPPAPSTTQSSIQATENNFLTMGSKVPGNHAAMAMTPLPPSASMEPISQWAMDGSRMTLENRSNSEPDNIGRTPKADQTNAANEATSSSTEGKQSVPPGTSRFGGFNFGASLFQKTVGLVLKPRQGNQAKLGDTNKFYYDEKLKRWVEEGAQAPAEEPALAPPPTITSFQNGTSDYNMNSAVNDRLPAVSRSPEPGISTPPGSSPAIPAMPRGSNQFLARGRTGVRSRYVDTFNKGGSSLASSTNLFNPPTAPSAKPANAAKFFIPTATPSTEQTSATESISHDEALGNGEITFMPTNNNNNDNSNNSNNNNDPFQNLTPSPGGNMLSFPSFDNISNKGTPGIGTNNHGSFTSPQSRRTSSWSDIHNNSFTPPPTMNEMTKTPPHAFMPNSHSGTHLRNFGDDLHEVEL